MTKIKENTGILSFVIIGSFIGTMLAAMSQGVVVYGQNVTGNETGTNVTKFGSFGIGVNGQNVTVNETTLAAISQGVAVNGQNVTLNETGAGVTQPAAGRDGFRLDEMIIDHAGGTFTSLQTDADNKTWIATGEWDLISDPSKANQSNSSLVSFNATIGMRGTDNAAGHEHKISEFNLARSSIDSSAEGSQFTFNGTGSIETDVGLYTEVPINVTIYDKGPAIVSIDTQTNEIKPQWIPEGGTVSVLIDERIEDHFGNTPVYGGIKKE